MNRGEIWWADLPEPQGAAPGYRRPVLVLQANVFNRSRIATIIVAVITTNLRLAAAPGNVLLTAAESGLPKDSVINVSQLLTVDKSALDELVGSVGYHVLQKVGLGVKLVLDL